ncbi:MAG: N-6 DNA methylase [Candidatus Helarchaeota archaeon]
MVKKKKNELKSVDLLNLALFNILNTMIFHENLSKNDRIKPLTQIKDNYRFNLISEWNKIIESKKNADLFIIGLDIIKSFPESPIIEEILEKIKFLALEIVNFGCCPTKINNVLGSIYNKYLFKITKGFYGAYFTQSPAAIVLANLILDDQQQICDFRNSDFHKNFRIVDPACGAGILLSSVYSVIRNKYAQINPNPDFNWLHKVLIEDIIWGYDIIELNTLLTLLNLVNFNPNTIFKKHNIFTLPIGINNNGEINLGSLDFLEKSENFGNFDIIIMNPPFSRSSKTNIKFGYVNRQQMKIMNKRLLELTSKIGFGGVGKAGLGAQFIILADKLLKTGGKLGVVIPRGILSGVSWKKIRELIMKNYEINYIISNYDPGNKLEGIEGWNWSTNTDLGEVIIIAEKKENPKKNNEILFVNIWKKPKNTNEGLELSHKIISKKNCLNKTLIDNKWKYVSIGSKNIAAIYKVPQSFLDINWHIPCVFAQPELNKFIIDLHRLNQIKFTPLNNLLLRSGADIKQIKLDFEKSKEETPYPIIFGLQSSMNRIFLNKQFIKYGYPRNQRSHLLFSKNNSNLLLASRLHITNDCILAAESESPVLATAFWELKLKNNEYLPLLLLWFNSTFGFVLILSHSVGSKAQTFRLKKEQLKKIPIPTEIDLKKAKHLYNKIKNTKLDKFSIEFLKGTKNMGIRNKIDEFFVNELNLSFNLASIYRLLINEPCLCLSRNLDSVKINA